MNRSKVSKLKTNIDCGKKIAFVFILRDGGNNASKHIKVNVYKHQISVPLFTDIASTWIRPILIGSDLIKIKF